ncbi:MAG: hypothetical protein ACOC4B_01810 [Bacteroidota bacterium]
MKDRYQWKRQKNISLHEYVVMPNHFHGILEITGIQPINNTSDVITINRRGNPCGCPPTGSKRLGAMVWAFESITTVE